MGRFCDQTIGWNRIGFLLSVAIIAIAAVALYHILRDIEVGEVIAALRIPIRTTSRSRPCAWPAAISR